jgi:hypothetical protein
MSLIFLQVSAHDEDSFAIACSRDFLEALYSRNRLALGQDNINLKAITDLGTEEIG